MPETHNPKVIKNLFDYVYNEIKGDQKKIDYAYTVFIDAAYNFAPKLILGKFDKSGLRHNCKNFIYDIYEFGQRVKGQSVDSVAKLGRSENLEEIIFILGKFSGGPNEFFLNHRLGKDNKELKYEHLNFQDIKNGKITGELKNSAALQNRLLVLTQNLVFCRYFFFVPTIAMGDSIHDVPMLNEATIRIATNPDDALRFISQKADYLVFKEGDDVKKLLDQINEPYKKICELKRIDYYHHFSIKPPAFLDVDNTLVKGFLLKRIVSKCEDEELLGHDDEFMSILEEEAHLRNQKIGKEFLCSRPFTNLITRILDVNGSYVKKGALALRIYDAFKRGMPKDMRKEKHNLWINYLKDVELYSYTPELISGISKTHQPILVSAEPLEITEALCCVPPFQNCLALDYNDQHSILRDMLKLPISNEAVLTEVAILQKYTKSYHKNALKVMEKLIDDVKKDIEIKGMLIEKKIWSSNRHNRKKIGAAKKDEKNN